FDYQTLIDHLLQPLSGTIFPILCRQVSHDVRTDMADVAAPAGVSPNSILLFDGVFLFRRELNSYWDFRVLLDVDADLSISRAITRDSRDRSRRREEKVRASIRACLADLR